MTIDETHSEIVDITSRIIGSGLSIDEKWPSKKGNRITWTEQSDISNLLKNMTYAEKYQIIDEARNYNFKMMDGAVLQFMYEFTPDGKELTSHRLGFFPSPNLKSYDLESEIYDQEKPFESEFYDMVEGNVVGFPVRFDYNSSPLHFKEIDHPYSHVSLGEYKFCRIPMNAPLTPSMFICFILRSFYFRAISNKDEIIPQTKFRHPNTIVEAETRIIHFNCM